MKNYQKSAQNRYNSKFDLVQLRLPLGTKERIASIINDGQSVSSYCVDVILKALDVGSVITPVEQERVPDITEESVPEPIAPNPEKPQSDTVKHICERYGDILRTDNIIQAEIISNYSVETLKEAIAYLDSPDAIQEEQLNGTDGHNKYTLEEMQADLEKMRAGEEAKLKEEREQKARREQEIKAANKSQILEYANRLRESKTGEMTEEEKEKEADREARKAAVAREFGY